MIVDTTSVDLTGSNPLFKRSDLRFMVFKGEQYIYFHEPIYADSIQVFLVTASGIDESNPLIKGTDYVIPVGNSELVADDAISEAKICYQQQGLIFNKNIVKGIRIIRPYPEADYQIQVRGQAYYRQISDYPGTGAGPEYSPALMASVIERVGHLEQIKNPMNNVIATDVEHINPLDEDLTGASEANHILNEPHEIDTTQNKYAIRPVYGTFYDTTDLKVVQLNVVYRNVEYSDVGNYIYDATQNVRILLTSENIEQYVGSLRLIEVRTELARYDETTDTGYYIVRGLDQGRTRISYTSAGVYDRIMIVKPFKGTVEINYHAFGGEVTIKDIYAMKHCIINLYSNLGNGNYVTEESLASHPSIRGLESRMNNVEDTIHLVRTSEFNYQSVTKVVEDPSHIEWVVPRKRWVDVATLYNKSWTEISGPPTQHSEEFCLECIPQGFCIFFTLKYNLATGKLSIEKIRSACKAYPGYGIEYFNERRVPEFRVVYVANQLNKGIVLQMNITSPVANTAPWRFRSVHTANASWDCIPGDGRSRAETTYMTVLPNQGTVWYKVANTRQNSTAYAVGDKVLYPGKTGYILSCSTAGTSGASIPTWPTTGNTIEDGTVVWKILEAYEGNETNTCSLSNPYTVFAGNIPVCLIDEESYRDGNISTGTDETTTYLDEPGKVELPGFEIRTIKEEGAFELSDIREFRFHIFDRYTGNMLVHHTVPFTMTDAQATSGEVIYFPLDLCSIECIVTKMTYGMFKIAIKSHSGTHSLINKRFDFRQLDFLFEESEV